jgi:two-component system sensor histidine kinase QseC
MKSIRRYLIIALLAAITLGNFVAAVYGYRMSAVETQSLLDTLLADTASLIKTTHSGSEQVSAQPSERLAFQIWTTDGVLVQRSANSGVSAITRFEEGYREENFEGYRWRVLCRLDSESGLWLLVAERIDIRVKLADSIILRATLPVVLSLPLIAAIVWLIVGNGLSLVGKLADELSAKRVDDLDRLNIPSPPVELVPVVDAINDLLGRLSGSVERERRFAADAAHELRTPLSAIKIHVHNLKRQFPEHADELQILDRDLRRLGHLIEQIMLLYRTAPDHYQANMRQIDLHALAQTVISDLFPEVDRKHQAISLEGGAQTITGDEASLVILLGNLIQNASKYSPEGASIQVNVSRDGRGVRLEVMDNGVGIPVEEIDKVFDRFHRVGGDRHGSAVDGCGLGLSIVRHIANLHHATIEIRNNAEGPGLTVAVDFPPDLKILKPAAGGVT